MIYCSTGRQQKYSETFNSLLIQSNTCIHFQKSLVALLHLYFNILYHCDMRGHEWPIVVKVIDFRPQSQCHCPVLELEYPYQMLKFPGTYTRFYLSAWHTKCICQCSPTFKSRSHKTAENFLKLTINSNNPQPISNKCMVFSCVATNNKHLT